MLYNEGMKQSYFKRLPLPHTYIPIPTDDPASRRRRRLFARIRELVSETSDLRFLTLTLHPSNRAALDLDLLHEYFKEFVRRVRRCYDFEYLVIVEKTKAGVFHLHVVVRSSYIPQSFLSDTWRDVTGSYIVDIRSFYGLVGGRRVPLMYISGDLRNKVAGKVAGYVSKYLGKGDFVFPRMWVSRGFDAYVWKHNRRLSRICRALRKLSPEKDFIELEERVERHRIKCGAAEFVVKMRWFWRKFGSG